jgi:putative oxidoreductase
MQYYRFYLTLSERLSMPFRWLPATLARIAVGWVFASTGWGKLQNLEQVTGFFAELGIPYPELQAPFVAGTELVCGALVLVGLLTRAAAVPLIGTMIVAIATAQWPQVESLAGLLGLVETLYIVLFAWLAIAGPGPLSIDALGRRALTNARSVEGTGSTVTRPQGMATVGR